jgi:hypothetical protein
MMEQQRRESVFFEVGLREPSPAPRQNSTGRERPRSVRFRSRDEIREVERHEDQYVEPLRSQKQEGSNRTKLQQPIESPLPPKGRSMMYRFGATALLLAAAVPLISNTSPLGRGAVLPIQPAEAGVIPKEAMSQSAPILTARDDSPTDVCTRWAQQCMYRVGTCKKGQSLTGI